MPTPGKRWRHVVLTTYGGWLPGDPRGFRTRQHKLHSSGDYRQPPQRGEHAGLMRQSREIANDSVTLPRSVRPTVAACLVETLQGMNDRVLAVAVAARHAHLLVELPDDLRIIRRTLGRCKSAASHRLRHDLPGRVWARDAAYHPINTPDYHRRTYCYILRQRKAWVWCYQRHDGFWND